MYCSHYDSAQALGKLSVYAKTQATQLIKLFARKDYKGYIPLLAYSGMSGVAFATMLSFYLTEAKVKHEMAYVRKKNEKAHGSRIEVKTYSKEKRQFVFVDDFIDSGGTFDFVIKQCVTDACCNLGGAPIRFLSPNGDDSSLCLLHRKIDYQYPEDRTLKMIKRMLDN